MNKAKRDKLEEGKEFNLRELHLQSHQGFLHGLDSKEFTCNARDLGSIPRLGRSPGEGNGHPLEYSGLENSMDRGAWQATVHGDTKSWTQLSDFHSPLYEDCVIKGAGDLRVQNGRVC